MKIIKYPTKEQFASITKRPVRSFQELYQIVQPIINAVKNEGDAALRHYTAKLDNVVLQSLHFTANRISEAAARLDPALARAIDRAAENIFAFHRAQKPVAVDMETAPGIRCWRASRPIEKVGLYIPGGTAPLFSSLLMLAIPAKIAGCKEIVVSTPPDADAGVSDALAYVAKLLELDAICLAGGAQAVAAMAFGTESVQKVDKILGPGNQYVSAAKQIVALEYQVAIDLVAGPTELLIIADESANPAFLAADLLSQAEHGIDSQVLLLSTSEQLIDAVSREVNSQLTQLKRKEIAMQCLPSAVCVCVESLKQALEFSNLYAPEHLILAVRNPLELKESVESAGSVFLGDYTPEALGDYASGTNHTLPTNGAARAYSGVSVDDFRKSITFQEATAEGLSAIAETIELMANAEGLDGHANAVRIRIEPKS